MRRQCFFLGRVFGVAAVQTSVWRTAGAALLRLGGVLLALVSGVFALSCVLAGSVIACGFWMQTQYYVRGAYLLPMQFGLLFAARRCVSARCGFFAGRLHHAVLGELTEAECEIMGTRVHLRVLRDSREYAMRSADRRAGAGGGGDTVCFILAGSGTPLFGAAFLERPEEALEALRCVENAPKLRLLPFRSVGTASGCCWDIRRNMSGSAAGKPNVSLWRSRLRRYRKGRSMMRCGADQWNEGQKGKGNVMGNLKQTLQKLWNRLGALWNRLHRPAPGKIMYIGGTDPLPPPLPRQEETCC